MATSLQPVNPEKTGRSCEGADFSWFSSKLSRTFVLDLSHMTWTRLTTMGSLKLVPTLNEREVVNMDGLCINSGLLC
jgi:hypothetical protein